MSLRLGTRGSALARWQANWVASRLQERGIEVELVPIVTAGDRSQGGLETFEDQGLFTKEIQRALLDGRIDLAVHSLKDLPTAPQPALCLAAVPERAPPGDVLLATGGTLLADLPPGAVVGTGSLRRRAQLLRFRGDLRIKDIRGNVDTRVRKLQQGEYDALVLAEAGVRRLGLEKQIAQFLPLEVMLPAPGQGALALETRAKDARVLEIASLLDHPPTRSAVLAERALLVVLEAGCTAPVAALGRCDGLTRSLIGRVASADGAMLLEATCHTTADDPETLGRQVAEALLAQGAASVIQASRQARRTP